MNKSERSAARVAKQIKYLSTKDCPHGHITPVRYTSNGQCCECNNAHFGSYYHTLSPDDKVSLNKRNTERNRARRAARQKRLGLDKPKRIVFENTNV